jgi:hypothetical protein
MLRLTTFHPVLSHPQEKISSSSYYAELYSNWNADVQAPY